MKNFTMYSAQLLIFMMCIVAFNKFTLLIETLSPLSVTEMALIEFFRSYYVNKMKRWLFFSLVIVITTSQCI